MNKVDIPIRGFAPDLDYATPGIIVESTGLLPTINGVTVLGENVNVTGLPALAAASRGAVIARKLDDSRRLIAGTRTKLYEASTSSWTDVTRVSGDYVGGVENRWRFTQFGNQTIATNRVDEMQESSSGAFDDLATAPKASIVEAVGQQIMAFDYNDGVNDYPDGWYTCAVGNSASWTPSIATGAVNGRLTDTPGPIRAGKRLGDNIIVYKERSMYIGQQEGPPIWWRWQLVPGEIGAVSQEAVVNVGTAHIFAAMDGFYYFDGSRPVPIDAEIRKWYNTVVFAQNKYKIRASHDKARRIVLFYLPDSAGSLSTGLAYNYQSNMWTKVGNAIGETQVTLEYIAPGLAYDDLGTFYSTYDNLPSIAYDSPFWTAGAEQIAKFNSVNRLQVYSDTSFNVFTQFFTGIYGDDTKYRTLKRIRLKYNISPDLDDELTHRAYVYSLGRRSGTFADYELRGYGEISEGKADVQFSDKFFRLRFDLPSAHLELTGYTLYWEDDGDE